MARQGQRRLRPQPTRPASGHQYQYADRCGQRQRGRLQAVKQLEAQSKETYKASDQYGMMVEKQTDAAIAADTLLQALKKQHKEGLEKSVKEQMKYLRSLEQMLRFLLRAVRQAQLARHDGQGERSGVQGKRRTG